jgi:hypothetical protein
MYTLDPVIRAAIKQAAVEFVRDNPPPPATDEMVDRVMRLLTRDRLPAIVAEYRAERQRLIDGD